MAYEIFARKSQRMGTPAISFTKIGQLAFNQSAARILQKEAFRVCPAHVGRNSGR